MPLATPVFYLPGIIALAVITACYTNLAIGIAFARDRGILRHLHGSPMPVWGFVAARMVHAVAVAVLLGASLIGLDAALFNIAPPANRFLPILVFIIAGGTVYSALGLAVTGLIPNADAASALVNATILPVLLVSSVFFPTEAAPAWIRQIASLFPVRPFVGMLRMGLGIPGSGFDLGNLVVLVLWGALSEGIATRFFSWEPRRS